MGECICSGCINLTGVIDDNGEVTEYSCSFGFPAEQCAECEADINCSLTCEKFQADDGKEEIRLVKCAGCGKELSQASKDDNDSEAFCFECYLKRM